MIDLDSLDALREDIKRVSVAATILAASDPREDIQDFADMLAMRADLMALRVDFLDMSAGRTV